MSIFNFVRAVFRRLAEMLRWCCGFGQFACISLAGLFIASGAALATTTTLYVDASVTSTYPTGSPPGNSWSNAFKYLHDAIYYATITLSPAPSESDPVVIKIAQGTYKPDQGFGLTAGTRTYSFTLNSNVAIMGGYRGGSTNSDDYDPSTLIAILSGDVGSGDSDSYHVVTAGSSTDLTALIDGCTITGGKATGSGTNEKVGGGIFIDQGHPKIRGCTITNNTAIDSGGGIMCKNTTTAPEIRNCTFDGNSAKFSTGSSQGGGLACDYDALVINCKFTNNEANASTVVPKGGAASMITGQCVEGVCDADLTFVNCEFITNHTQGEGGSVSLANGGSLTMINCKVSDSTAGEGGGIFCNGCAFNLENCTVVDCSATQEFKGGGMDLYAIQASTIRNCIFWGNTSPGEDSPYSDVYDTGANMTVRHSVTEQDPIMGENGTVIHVDPQFVNAGANDYSLACDSPCIDAGDNAVVDADTQDVDENNSTNETTPDLDLNHRNVSALVTSNLPLVDMGVYEKQLTKPCSSPPTADIAPVPCTDGQVNIDDLVIVITNWGTCLANSTFCPGDIAASHTSVDIDDLVAVITHWSNACTSGYNAGSFTSVEDCMDAATLEFTPHTQDWDEYVQKCVAGLCAAEIIDCD